MKKIFKFVFGGLLIIGALGMFAKSEILAGLISIVLGVIILPPISNNIKEKFKLWNSSGIRYISYAVLCVIIGMATDKSKFPKSNNDLSKKTTQTITNKENSTLVETGKSGVYNGNGEKVGSITEVKKEDQMDNSEFWENYSSAAKERIHELIKNKDCQGLQKEFDNAHNNNQAQKNRTGRNNAELLDFIDNAMYKMGCYK